MVKAKLSDRASAQFQENGFIHLHQFLDHGQLLAFAADLRIIMKELDPNTVPMEDRDTYKRAFTQVTNLWQKSDPVREFVFNRGLAQLAAQIMGVRGVRLYHDQALFKEAGGGATPWHVDQVYWPLDTNKTCTFWIPLQDTPLEMGALAFARGSHKQTSGRDMVISEASEAFFANLVNELKLDVVRDAFDLGDISVHNGWTVHNASPNRSSKQREVMTIIYMADDTCLLENPSETQLIDRDAFVPGVQPGKPAATELNPVLFSTS